MDKSKAICSINGSLEDSFDAFIANLYRIFHCATVSSIPPLERFKYLYFTDELIHEQFRELHRNDDSVLPDLCNHFQDRLSHFISESHFLLKNDLLPQLAEKGFVYQTSQTDLLQKKNQLLDCVEKIDWKMDDFQHIKEEMFKKIKDNHLNYLIIWKSNPKFTIVTIPHNREKVVILPDRNYHHKLYHLDDLLQVYMQKNYPDRVVQEIVPFRLTIDCLYEKNQFLKIIERPAPNALLKTYSCLEIAQFKTPDILHDVLKMTHIPAENCFIEPSLHQAGDFFHALIAQHPKCAHQLLYPPLVFQPTHLLTSPKGCFEKIQANDVLFHHPYQPYDEVLDFFATAATDNNVTSISMTIYRIEKKSPLLNSLKLAASCGKRVRVLIELRVTGYEKYHWKIAQDLRAHGIEVSFGSPEYVTHAKMALITRKTAKGIDLYSHLSTGNYHQKNLKTYCDLSLLTSHPGIGADIDKIFRYIFESEPLKKLDHVWVSPQSIRTELLALIHICVAEAKQYHPTSIFIKTKDFTDLELVNALNEAARCGVNVVVFVRNINFLISEKKWFATNIKVISYVGRLLEHHRVYCFKTRHEEKIFLGSCNMVKKNIDKRIELIFPIYQPAIQQKIKEEVIENIQKNTNHSWAMDQHGEFQFIRNTTKDFQTALIEKYADKSE